MLHPHLTLPVPLEVVVPVSHPRKLRPNEVVRNAQAASWEIGLGWADPPIPHPFPLPHCGPEDGQRRPLLMPRVGTYSLSHSSASPTLSPPGGRRYPLLRIYYSLGWNILSRPHVGLTSVGWCVSAPQAVWC